MCTVKTKIIYKPYKNIAHIDHELISLIKWQIHLTTKTKPWQLLPQS